MKPVPVISISKPKHTHVKHLAMVNAVIYPDDRQGEIALTFCGRAIHYFQDVTNVADHYTNSTIFMTYCPLCFPERETK